MTRSVRSRLRSGERALHENWAICYIHSARVAGSVLRLAVIPVDEPHVTPRFPTPHQCHVFGRFLPCQLSAFNIPTSSGHAKQSSILRHETYNKCTRKPEPIGLWVRARGIWYRKPSLSVLSRLQLQTHAVRASSQHPMYLQILVHFPWLWERARRASHDVDGVGVCVIRWPLIQ